MDGDGPRQDPIDTLCGGGTVPLSISGRVVTASFLPHVASETGAEGSWPERDREECGVNAA